MALPDVAEGEGAREEQQAPEDSRESARRRRARRRRRSSRRGAHETRARCRDREALFEERQNLVHQVLGVPRVGRVLVEAVGGLVEGDDHGRDLEPVDEVVEHVAEAGEADEVGPVVRHEKRDSGELERSCAGR